MPARESPTSQSTPEVPRIASPKTAPPNGASAVEPAIAINALPPAQGSIVGEPDATNAMEGFGPNSNGVPAGIPISTTVAPTSNEAVRLPAPSSPKATSGVDPSSVGGNTKPSSARPEPVR